MLNVVQILRRFETTGGMESYVWHLSHELAKLDVHVHILCQQSEQTINSKNISIHLLKKVPPKPGWFATAAFSSKASKWIRENSKSDWIIHSHERTSVHHVTTFHGTPFANIRNKPWWNKVSIRVAAWLYMEKRELCSDNVRVVFPNSDMVRKELNHLYPCIGDKLKKPAYPGINKVEVDREPFKNKSFILFIGKEWKRKGLDRAISIVKYMREKDSSVQLWVLGPKKNDIQHLFKDWKGEGGYKILGWRNPKDFFPIADLLLHPANYEPYGMAISESTSFGVPVVVSDKCGISSKITKKSGAVIQIDKDISYWADSCFQEINRKSPVSIVGESWKSLSQNHAAVYHKLQKKYLMR